MVAIWTAEEWEFETDVTDFVRMPLTFRGIYAPSGTAKPADLRKGLLKYDSRYDLSGEQSKAKAEEAKRTRAEERKLAEARKEEARRVAAIGPKPFSIETLRLLVEKRVMEDDFLMKAVRVCEWVSFPGDRFNIRTIAGYTFNFTGNPVEVQFVVSGKPNYSDEANLILKTTRELLHVSVLAV